MQDILKKIFAGMASWVCALSMLTGNVSADEAYDVYNYDRWGEAIPSQAGYLADRSVSGLELGIGDFSSPSDIFRADDGMFYIADTGNNRIVVVNSEFDEVVDIIDSFEYNGDKLTLKNPGSIFITDNTLYVADTDNSRVLRCDKDGKLILLLKSR